MLSRTAVHAVRALSYLAVMPDGAYAGAWELAKRIGAPRNYLGKLLQNIVVTGLVESRRGAGGGFRLARPPEEITLFDVVNPIDHVIELRRCILGQEICSADKPCALHSRWAVIRDIYIDLLSSTTIADVARSDTSPELGERSP